MVKLLRLISGQLMISEIEEDSNDSLKLKNPMIIDVKYNEQMMPQFRYVPWQILSEDNTVDVSQDHVVMKSNPKTDLLDAYQQICIGFIPLEKDEDE